ncbi:MAG TPA: sigma-70 family RNA polymerase sigma factor [Candidatus Dormibacteraeota bacterium]|nr:sigma-70 family RNA polymerase sigma factor [Candidatus Dormibacteraeota bacterium]
MEQVAVNTASDRHADLEQAFRDVLTPLVNPGFRLACAMLHDAQAAEDAVQDASFIAWRKFKKLDDRGRAQAWFLAIVANECRNAKRRGWRSRVHLGLPAAMSVGSGEDRAVRNADLRRALLQLGHDDRLVVVLYYYFDMPFQDIASVAGRSLSSVRNRLYRTIKRLRPDLAMQEDVR